MLGRGEVAGGQRGEQLGLVEAGEDNELGEVAGAGVDLLDWYAKLVGDLSGWFVRDGERPIRSDQLGSSTIQIVKPTPASSRNRAG